MRGSWTKAFLDQYRNCGNVTASARAVGISRQAVYDKLEADENFKREFDSAEIEAGDLLELEARRRAHDGVDEPVYYKGEVCGTVRKYSDTLLIVLLKGTKPEKYRENIRQETVGDGGGAVKIDHDFESLRKLPAEELLRLHRETLKSKV